MALSRFFRPTEKKCLDEESSSSEDDSVIEILDDEEETFEGGMPIQTEENDPNIAKETNGVQTYVCAPGAKLNEEATVDKEESHYGNRNEPTGSNNATMMENVTSDGKTNEAKEVAKVIAIESSTNDEGDSAAASTAPTTRTNPFAKFAFQKESSASFSMPKRLSSSTVSNPTKPFVPPTKKARTKNKDWIRMRDIAKDEQERIVNKWHSFVHENTDLEDARFQILVAARLHARCQEGPVKQAMKALRDKLGESAFSVNTLADTEPEELNEAIRNLQYYPIKAKHIVKAAQEIRSQYRGIVPEQESELRQLTGIGPVMGDLLAFVNTRKMHRQLRQSDKMNKINDASPLSYPYNSNLCTEIS